MSRKQRFYWHVPSWSEDAAGPVNFAGRGNVGDDLVVELVNTDFAAPGDPRQDNFVVERVVGQWMLRALATAEAGDRFVHTRVYVADGDQSAVSLRDLYTQDDADSSWLWHNVSSWSGSAAIGNPWGSLVPGAVGDPIVPFRAGRFGDFDIKVGRRVEEGQSLIWHTQLQPPGAPLVDDTFFLHLWCRVLMREG